MTVLARPIEARDLPLLFEWRNHDSVRSMMLAQHEIGWQEHTSWFDRISGDRLRVPLIIEEDSLALGYVYLNPATLGSVADWGFYSDPQSPKGTGRKIGQAGLAYAFEVLGVHKVCGQVLAYNQASLRFHASFGFQQEGILRSHHKLQSAYHDLVCFGLLKSEWASRVSLSQNYST